MANCVSSSMEIFSQRQKVYSLRRETRVILSHILRDIKDESANLALNICIVGITQQQNGSIAFKVVQYYSHLSHVTNAYNDFIW